MTTPKDTLPDYIKNRFAHSLFRFGIGQKDVDILILRLLKCTQEKYLIDYGVYSHDLIPDTSDTNHHWDHEKRAQIFDCILNLSNFSDAFASSAQIIGAFLNNPISGRELGKFKKQVSFLLENADEHIKALLVGMVALGLLHTNKRLNKIIRQRSEDVGGNHFDRWFDIQESENELCEFLSKVTLDIEERKEHTSKSIADLEDKEGGAE